MYHYTLIQTSVDLQQKKAAQTFHRSTLSLSESGCKGRHFFYIYQIFYKLFFEKNYSILIYRKESLLVMPLNQGND